MARRKTAVMDSPAEPPPSEANGTLPEEPPTRVADPPQEPTTSPSEPNGQKRKPEVSYRCYTDRTTRLEVAVWTNDMQAQDGSTYKQHAITFKVLLQRSPRLESVMKVSCATRTTSHYSCNQPTESFISWPRRN